MEKIFLRSRDRLTISILFAFLSLPFFLPFCLSICLCFSSFLLLPLLSSPSSTCLFLPSSDSTHFPAPIVISYHSCFYLFTPLLFPSLLFLFSYHLLLFPFFSPFFQSYEIPSFFGLHFNPLILLAVGEYTEQIKILILFNFYFISFYFILFCFFILSVFLLPFFF